MREIFVFLGSPGSGKGSLANLCVENLGWDQLSTGNLCRKHIAEQTKIGKEIDFAIKSGKLISDSLVTRMVDEWFSSMDGMSHSVILDGYPRTVAQAQAFSELLKSKLSSLNLRIIRLTVSDQVIVDRLCKRYVCTNKDCQAVYSLMPNSDLAPKKSMLCDRCGNSIGRRSDDEQEAISKRLEVYHKHEKELLVFFHNIGFKIHEVNVEKPLSQVFVEFRNFLSVEPA